MSYKISNQCRTCKKLHTGGIKGGKYDRWCCKYGKEASKAIGHCKVKGGYEPKQKLIDDTLKDNNGIKN